ncbi:MAG: flagellin [Clostridia bacterium]|nr:flagellin [Clostridia bacterium]
MRINHNLSALNAWKNLVTNDDGQNKTLEKLSSGLRIGRAADDAAGLSISEKMRGQIKGLNQASRNAQDGISLLQTAEGALSETHSILQRMRELAVQSASDTVTGEDRYQIQKEMDALSSEITRIGNTTEFNTQSLLTGGFADKTIHIGANATQNLKVTISDMRSTAVEINVAAGTTFDNQSAVRTGGAGTLSMKGKATGWNAATVALNVSVVDVGAGDLQIRFSERDASGAEAATGDVDIANTGTGTVTRFGVDFTFAGGTAGAAFNGIAISNTGGGIDVRTQGNANTAITQINTAITYVSSERSKLGAIQNRLDHTIANLATSSENLTAAESRIRDVDIAVEMMSFTKYQILSQASTAMLAQANQKPQAVLQLLR